MNSKVYYSMYLKMLCAAIVLLAFIAPVKAQSNKKDRVINVKFNGEPLPSALKKIEKAANVYFLYNNNLIKQTDRVTGSFISEPLDIVLQQLFKGKGIDYTYRKNAIILRAATNNDNDKKIFHVQNPRPERDTALLPVVAGMVTNEGGVPLEGVAVMVAGTETGVLTDKAGRFVLNNVHANDILEFNYIGYQVLAEPLNGETFFTIQLLPKENNLDDIVAKGYYTTTQQLNTGNVSVVKADVIGRQPVSDPLAALEGRVPGLQITQSSGVPGGQFKVQLRGRNSIANGNDPLYVVDGIPYTSTTLSSTLFVPGGGTAASPFNYLNPDNIESITVLKDADATAIYGSRGANGVILITTKKGRIGKTTADFNVYSGFGKVDRQLKLLNTQQYLEMRHEAFANDGTTPGATDYDINGTWDTTRYTNWEKVFIGNTSHVTDAEGSLSGGNEQTQFTLGSDYRKETTVFPGDFYNQKISFHTGISHTSLNKKFHADFTASYANDYSQLPSSDLTGNIFLAPDAPLIYNNDGSLNWANSTWVNPYGVLLQTDKTSTNNLISNLFLSYQLFTGLQIKSSFGYNTIEMEQTNLIPSSSFNPSFSNPSKRRKNEFGTNKTNSWIIEPQISYTKTVGKGHIDALIGTSFQQQASNSIYQVASGFSDDDQIENVSAASTITLGGYQNTIYRYNAIYGRIGYNWEEKYIINVTARRDGSSRFGPGNQFGNFGAVGAAWIFSKEKFIKNNVSFLSFGKLRASYGSTGNDQLGDYKYLSTYTSSSYAYQGVSGLYPTQLTNPYYGWERVNKLELGLNLGFIHNRILLDADWYRNRTGNQLVGYALPAITGFTSVQANLPAVIQNTGLEFELNTINVQNKNFNWTTSANISFPRNRLVSFPNLSGSSYATRYAIGQPLSVQFLYHYTGMDPQTGLYQFTDLNGDGKITNPQDLQPVFVGVNFSGGLDNSLTYKDWQLDFFLQFAKQRGQEYLMNIMPGIVGLNQPKTVLSRWQKSGDITNIPAYSESYSGQEFQNVYIYFNSSDGIIGDASFVRLKNVSLSWQIPDSWKKSMHIQNASLYIQCQNLLTISGYKGLDPETLGGTVLPPIRMLTAGIKLSL
ncbi:MAG: SusC/RagA family TonB-linked outer membrane protein [Chitinophagaceae bacterium]|nr:MAG: SusC/RagA family TonB-linked outer membrane protein [Chitinophagaceae bacterium]